MFVCLYIHIDNCFCISIYIYIYIDLYLLLLHVHLCYCIVYNHIYIYLLIRFRLETCTLMTSLLFIEVLFRPASQGPAQSLWIYVDLYTLFVYIYTYCLTCIYIDIYSCIYIYTYMGMYIYLRTNTEYLSIYIHIQIWCL